MRTLDKFHRTRYSKCNHAKDLKYALAVLDVNEKALETDE